MRFLRVKADGQGFDHCVSRVVAQRFIFQAGYGPARCQALQQKLKSPFDLSTSLGSKNFPIRQMNKTKLCFPHYP